MRRAARQVKLENDDGSYSPLNLSGSLLFAGIIAAIEFSGTALDASRHESSQARRDRYQSGNDKSLELALAALRTECYPAL